MEPDTNLFIPRTTDIKTREGIQKDKKKKLTFIFIYQLRRRLNLFGKNCNLNNFLVPETMGQTVENPRGQPGKTVPGEFPRAQPEGTREGQFFPGCPRLFNS